MKTTLTIISILVVLMFSTQAKAQSKPVIQKATMVLPMPNYSSKEAKEISRFTLACTLKHWNIVRVTKSKFGSTYFLISK